MAELGINCEGIADCYAKGGWWWAVAMGVSLLLRWYQSAQGEAFASMFAPKAQWSRLPFGIKFTVSVLLSCAATTLVGMHAGQIWWGAFLSGLPAAVMAAGFDRHISAMTRVVKPDDSISIKTQPPKIV